MACSQAEVEYCALTVKNGLRLDGRAWNDLRPLELELGVIAQAAGSARVHLGDTDVVLAVKAEVAPPRPSHPDCGQLSVTVECSPCASPEYEGRGGEAWGLALAAALQASLAPPGPSGKAGGLDLIPLNIIRGKAAWHLYLDALVLNDGGGVLAALSAAALAALTAARLPRVTVTRTPGPTSGSSAAGQEAGLATDMDLQDDAQEGEGGGDEPEIELEEDESGEGGVPLQGLGTVPLLVSVALVRGQAVVDPGLLEEKAAASVLHVAVNSAGELCGVNLEGNQPVDAASLAAALETGMVAAPAVIRQLNSFLTSVAGKS
ncbi:ribosomal protein S5 domain 2-type protein [Haematococcus lacustris]